MILASDHYSNNSALFLMASMSPAAADAIETESYRRSQEQDGTTEQVIVEDVFVHLLKDIQLLGLTIDVGADQIMEDKKSLFSFLSLASYLLPNTLYQHLKTDAHLKSCVHHLLSGTLAADEPLIASYLSELGGLDAQPAIVEELSDTIDYYFPSIHQTSIFTDYLRNVYQLVDDEKLVVDASTDDHQQYRDKIKDVIGRFSDALAKFEGYPLFNDAVRIRDYFIHDLVAPDNFIRYNYLFTQDPSLLPVDLIESFHQKWYHYRVSHMWCGDYYKIRKLVCNEAQLLAMHAFLYAMNKDSASFERALQNDPALPPSSKMKQVIVNLYKE